MIRIILKEDIPGQGRKNDIVEVSDGFARNFLFPKNKAYPATSQAINKIEIEKATAAKTEEKERDKREKDKKRIEETELVIMKKAKNGKLFGGVTAKDIALALKGKRISVSPKQINIKETIKSVGKHNIGISLDSNNKAQLQLLVTAEENK